MSRIEGKRALVSGATRGIGLAIARALLARGARVVVCARNGEEVEKTVIELDREFDGRAYGQACDVGRYEEVKALFDKTGRLLGGLEILVNNAGVGYFANVEEMSVEQWRATIDTNLSGLFYCCREALPLMKRAGGGHIINIGSLAGKNAFAGGAAYNASKFGVVGFSEALMQETRYDHIKVSYVMPGSVNTDFGRSAAEDPATSWKLLPEDVAEVVVHLLEQAPRALASRVELRPAEPKK